MAKCPASAEALAELLGSELLEIPHITMTDVDLSTGDVIVWLTDGQRYRMAISKDAGDAG